MGEIDWDLGDEDLVCIINEGRREIGSKEE